MAGQKGRPPKPTALKVIEGNKGKRPLPTNEVQPDIKIPRCPRHLSADAKREWKRITVELEKLGLISEIDSAAMALYCQAYGRWIEAERKMDDLRKRGGGDGLIVKSPKGYPIQNPYLAIANRAMEQVYQFLQQFGMSPSARSRVTPSPQIDMFGGEDGKSGAGRFFTR